MFLLVSFTCGADRRPAHPRVRLRHSVPTLGFDVSWSWPRGVLRGVLAGMGAQRLPLAAGVLLLNGPVQLSLWSHSLAVMLNGLLLFAYVFDRWF
jgi:hypothetical protein